MPIAHDIIVGKSRGFVEGCQRTPDREQSNRPGTEYGANYNGLRQMVIDAYPQFVPALPPAASNRMGANDALECAQTYRELQGWGIEIYRLLGTVSVPGEAPSFV